VNIQEMTAQYEGANEEQKLFCLLVDVATEYEKVLSENWSPTTTLAGLTPRQVLLKGLAENLEANEEDRG